MFAIISKDSEYLWLNMLLLWGRCVDNSIKEKVGNICDLGTITNQFLSHRYLLLFFKKTENVQSGNKKCSKFLWHNQILPCWRKSQILATFDVTRSNPSIEKDSKYLWLWNCYLSVPKSQIFAIFWKGSEYLWLGNWLGCLRLPGYPNLWCMGLWDMHQASQCKKVAKLAFFAKF